MPGNILDRMLVADGVPSGTALSDIVKAFHPRPSGVTLSPVRKNGSQRAMITFLTVDDAKKALSAGNSITIDGTRVMVTHRSNASADTSSSASLGKQVGGSVREKEMRRRQEMQRKRREEQEKNRIERAEQNSRTVYVGNLPWAMTRQQLSACFERLARVNFEGDISQEGGGGDDDDDDGGNDTNEDGLSVVERATIVADQDGRPRGFGFVTMVNKNLVETACKRGTVELWGRKITISPRREPVRSRN